jgi:hypothetical protein
VATHWFLPAFANYKATRVPKAKQHNKQLILKDFYYHPQVNLLSGNRQAAKVYRFRGASIF